MKRGGPLRRRTPLRAVGKKGARDRRELDTVRADLLFRSLGHCEARGFSDLCTGYGAHAHHIVRRAQGGTNDLTNLAWLCAPCHRKVHDCPVEALRAGLLRPSGEAA